eukprot:CAMPEP_0174984636 /NCGR_PEP_ID=MMETSP0004_2-20121128/17845_1 /TAXON_ID=420556 /ORGANISM="Ochromonas sp., Strain CCMP1393" /LENGTH=143 /DNA_ID=CAMNT_0016237093 /DNA_START=223 /DNA_END=654 /DNA_ORIENTATION=+
MKSFSDIIALPPSALQGLSPAADEVLAKLRVKTIKQLGNWKAYKVAKAVVELSEFEEPGARHSDSASSLKGLFDADVAHLPLKELIKLPPDAVNGVSEKSNEVLAELRPARIRTVKQLGTYKYAKIAEQLCVFAKYESIDSTQ